MVELGETTIDAIRREVAEECSCDVRVVDVAGVITRVVRDGDGRVRYHWVLVDYLAYADSDRIEAGTDAAEARWATLPEIEQLDVTDGLLDMIHRALALAEKQR